MRPWVVLIGPPGAGKTTVAELLAKRTGRAVRDTDRDVEQRAGKPVADIFVDDGEPVFRALEQQAVAAALAGHDGVLSLGGGAVVSDATRGLLGGHTVVFLDVGLAQAARRVGLGGSRPLLLGNVRGQLKALLDARRPLYREIATHTVSTDDLLADQVAERVLELLGPPA